MVRNEEAIKKLSTVIPADPESCLTSIIVTDN